MLLLIIVNVFIIENLTKNSKIILGQTCHLQISFRQHKVKMALIIFITISSEKSDSEAG